MSHSCPECGMCCHCSGDIEDHDTGEEYTMRCTCCDSSTKDEDDDGPELGNWAEHRHYYEILDRHFPINPRNEILPPADWMLNAAKEIRFQIMALPSSAITEGNKLTADIIAKHWMVNNGDAMLINALRELQAEQAQNAALRAELIEAGKESKLGEHLYPHLVRTVGWLQAEYLDAKREGYPELARANPSQPFTSPRPTPSITLPLFPNLNPPSTPMKTPRFHGTIARTAIQCVYPATGETGDALDKMGNELAAQSAYDASKH